MSIMKVGNGNTMWNTRRGGGKLAKFIKQSSPSPPESYNQRNSFSLKVLLR